jgi:glycosyltransferase involved in cell wall biosynthesis
MGGARIAVVKPDWGVVGGAELVLERVEGILREEGHRVERRTVEVDSLPHRVHGLDIPDHVWGPGFECFRYLAMIEAFERLDLSGFDVVMSTQPPSFTVDHPRHVSLFYHHLRIYYDLSDVCLRAGIVNPTIHDVARHHVREIDQPRLERVRWFLCNSERVAERLRDFNGITNTSAYHAGVAVGDEPAAAAPAAERSSGPVLCVSRHEFPKRTELVVHALKLLPRRRGALVGTGGRLPWVQTVDARLSRPGVDLGAVRAEDLWLNTGLVDRPEAPSSSDVALLGHVSDDELLRLYRTSLCVVAPAYDEDYGLTVIEAMSHGAPVIACRDGGNLADLVDDGVDGFVVEPTGPAIAAAVERLAADPDLVVAMSAAAREKAATFTWERARRELLDGFARVLG